MNEQKVLFEKEAEEKDRGPVECLGMTFENDEKRREYFLEKLREKLKDPEFRKIEGFPIGADEDILALSDPPYYTACPNPFIGDFIKHYGKPFDPENDNYKREPFAADVSEGKNDPIYNAHSYHTKVPHKAIMRYILHYTEPGDIVFDGFCGTGMTGVAAQLCGDKDAVESLGYKVNPDDSVIYKDGISFSPIGPRLAVLNDLSPTATFIAYNYNTPIDIQKFEIYSNKFFYEVDKKLEWIYQTKHINNQKCRISFTVWSEVFHCNNCGEEIIFLKEAYNPVTKKVKSEFPCPNCKVIVSKRNIKRSFETFYDKINQSTKRRIKRFPLYIHYLFDDKKYTKLPDGEDLSLLKRVDDIVDNTGFPSIELPFMHISHVKDKMSNFGITHLSHFFLSRAQYALSFLLKEVNNCIDWRHRLALLFMVEQAIWAMTILNRFRPTGYSQVNQYMSGVFYIPSQTSEISPWYILTGKYNRLKKVFSYLPRTRGAIVSLNSTCQALPNDNSIDYIFTDPPFGENLQYSELNWFNESFYRVFPNINTEAVVNKAQKKDVIEYMDIMALCFKEYYRVLKPGRWMTVVFHNSKNSIWNAIQEAMLKARFVVADIRVLDKQQQTYKQSTQGVVKADLVISAYKPNGGLEERFKIEAGTEEGAWDFVRTHLKQLPVFVTKDGKAEMIAERQNYLLFDRMVAFHVQRGVAVPLSAAEFYRGLEQRFSYREGMYFLVHQAAEFDKKRMTVKEILQLDLFVTDEASAIQWLKQLLIKKPQTFQEIHPQFLKKIGGWHKYEKTLELSLILEQNFLRCDGKEGVPNQVHSYLSTNYKDLRNLPKDDPALRAKAKDRWYVPDPNNAADLEKLRERSLLKEFAEYLPPGYVPPKYDESQQLLPGMNPGTVIPQGKRLKIFRLEAVRAGFKKAWQERDYVTIIAVARRISETVLQEDPKLLMWYDQARTRLGID